MGQGGGAERGWAPARWANRSGCRIELAPGPDHQSAPKPPPLRAGFSVWLLPGAGARLWGCPSPQVRQGRHLPSSSSQVLPGVGACRCREHPLPKLFSPISYLFPSLPPSLSPICVTGDTRVKVGSLFRGAGLALTPPAASVPAWDALWLPGRWL